MENNNSAMKVVEITEPGKPNVLKLASRQIPLAIQDEVIIKVEAAGVNRPDLMQRAGVYPPPKGASDLPGLEVAGKIFKQSELPSRWKVGDRVCALVNGGGYAEYVKVHAGQCLPIPDNLNYIQAASLPETFFTVWVNVFDRAQLKKGESLLVQGGASGIGVSAIQIASAMGSQVFVTAGTETKCKKCELLGASKAINYKTQNFSKIILEETGGQGVNVILDMVGGDYIQQEIECLADDGRISLIATQGGHKTNFNLIELLKRRLTITGSTLRPRSTDYKTKIANDLEKNVWPLIENGRIKPVIDSTFPLDHASKAHELMEDGKHFGKIVLTVD